MTDFRPTGQALASIDDKLDNHSIKGAISLLKTEADRTSDWESIGKLNNIAEGYKYLCHYFLEGTPDTTRHDMLASMAEQVREVRDRMKRASLSDSPCSYFASVRLAEMRNYEIVSLLGGYKALMSRLSLAETAGSVPPTMASARYEMLDEIFTAAMVAFQDKKGTNAMRQVFDDADSDSTLKVQLISAIILGLLICYDSMKLDLLFDIALGDNTDSLKAKAYIGIVFAILIYTSRIKNNKNLAAKLATLSDDETAVSRLRTIIKAIAGTSDTQRISEKMSKEVIPEIMKLRPDILNKMKGLGADADPESIENNPEWQEMLDKSGIARKLEELSEMQSDGADLMMVTFSQLKQFPFFRNINNWFLPFDSRNPQLHISEDISVALDKITGIATFICDSDKYSLALGLAQTPENQRKMLSAQFDAQFQQMTEDLKDKLPSSSRPDFEREAIKTIRDFYRYLMLGRNTQGFANPFSQPINFTAMPEIGEKLAEPGFLRIMAEFYMKRGFYAEALPLFKKLAETDSAESTVWQKIGFCMQKNKDFKGAREAYMKSELLGDDSQWLLKKLAFVNKRLGDYPSAMEYYEKVLICEPDNISMILNAANMGIQANNIDAALKHYYHADYLKPGESEIMRGLGWAELLAGNLDKAENIHSMLLLSEPDASDWLNAGHVAQLKGNYRTALERYRKAAASGKSDFEIVYNADIPVLKRLGADQDGIYILLDETIQK